jgi:hypothetical protein
MPMIDPPEIEALLAMWGEGNREALCSLMALPYDELRRETAEALGKSPATVKRDCSTPRIWLYQHLNGEAQS